MLPSLRGFAAAVYFLVASLGALAPLFVGALIGWFDYTAPYHDEDDPDVRSPALRVSNLRLLIYLWIPSNAARRARPYVSAADRRMWSVLGVGFGVRSRLVPHPWS